MGLMPIQTNLRPGALSIEMSLRGRDVFRETPAFVEVEPGQ
jgi:hypothetical protein